MFFTKSRTAGDLFMRQPPNSDGTKGTTMKRETHIVDDALQTTDDIQRVPA